MASRPPSRPRDRSRPTGARGTRPTPKKAPAAGTGPQITTRAVILLSVLLLLLASYTASFRAWWGARQELQSTRAEAVALRNEIKSLEEQKDRFDDPAFIRQQARERFGWVMPGEVGYRVIGADGSVRGQVPELDEPPEIDQPQWYDKLWGSVATAGTEEGDGAPADDPTDEPLEDSQ